MPVLDTQGKTGKIVVDDEGYLVNIDEWDEHVAQTLAEREGIPELTAEKLDILTFIHEYYKKYDFFPILGAVCKKVSKPKDCMIEEFSDPLVAWKLAGLPHPEEPLISLLTAGQTPG